MLLLSGPGASDIFASRWTGPTIISHDRQYFGRFRLDLGDRYEEAVVFSPQPDEIEIHCHGGEAVVTAIESALTHDGAIAVPWKVFFRPDHIHKARSHNTTSQKEIAFQMLVAAPTERTAQILLAQHNGALERELEAIETLPEPEKRQRRKRLQENAKLAKHLVEPFRVALAGAVNAGKSSLLNALLGFQRAIVALVPGTTRDAVSGRTAVDGFPVEFIDTAGFRDIDVGIDAGTGDLERQGMEIARRTLAQADLVLHVVDVTAQVKESMLDVPAEILVLNKIDLLEAGAHGMRPEGDSAVVDAVCVSAMTGEGIEQLLERIARRLVPDPPLPLEAVPLTEWRS